MKTITTIEQLKEEATEEGGDFFISLGVVKSSKYITWYEDTKTFSIFNEIDGTEQELTETEIMDDNYTNIGKAMRLNQFFKY